MKKTALLIVCAGLLLGAFCGCARQSADAQEGLSIVCTAYPQYDFVKNIVGQTPGIQLSLLLDRGADPHSFQPGADDMIAIATSDLFISIGSYSERWVTDALREQHNKDRIAVSLLELVQPETEEFAEGMQQDEHEHTDEEETEYDEHVWLSLRNAVQICSSLCDLLCTLDPEDADQYRQNCGAYVEKLHALDENYTEMVRSARRNVILVADRFPFQYLVRDYGLTYYAAFAGCSAETEASFDTVAFLAGKVSELSLPVVLVIESSDCRIADTVVQSAGGKAKILTLHSIQSVTDEQIRQGEDYLSLMKQNLEVLRKALNDGIDTM